MRWKIEPQSFKKHENSEKQLEDDQRRAGEEVRHLPEKSIGSKSLLCRRGKKGRQITRKKNLDETKGRRGRATTIIECADRRHLSREA